MKIYLTLLSTDSYLKYALTLYQSYLNTNSKYAFYIGVGKLVSENTKNLLSIKKIPFIEITSKYQGSTWWQNQNKANNKDNWNYVWEKIEFFNLLQFDQICCLDADMLILQNIDDIFKNKTKQFYASPRGIHSLKIKEFHCGCLVFCPSHQLYIKICKTFEKNPNKYGCEASLLWDSIEDYDMLNFNYNILESWQHPNIWKFLELHKSDIKIFHFDSIKPLQITKEHYNQLTDEIKQYFDKWQETYEKWYYKKN